ncbi:YjbF family lipoprotein [Marinomonas sp. M1K-6]|uniref:YjbF family lipoprotein n=1 Tax=Marinomonas profundi TaxID=2726122 RepID=A0A847RDE8_9GAMM|nr:YjbF family lipoprotein [Marinomonas profundi]NLQ19074.1 YjbF family lipoprotein [Marinomonas profundi]UDV04219.1 YjbF family lipoprotein [Marinomonas profundi]
MRSFRYYLYSPFFIFLLALTGCSSNFKSSIDSAKAVIGLNQAITPDYIASLPYASVLVTVNNTRPLLLILTFADYNPATQAYRLTWLTKDIGSIVTENGRIIHTVGFITDNLEALASTNAAITHNAITNHVSNGASANTFVSGLPKLGSTTSWIARYDWSPGYRYGFTAQVASRSLGMDTVTTDLWRQDAEQISETVTFDDLDAQFTNLFWLTPATETVKPFVVKSIQYLGPNMDKVEMLMVKPFIEPLTSTIEAKTIEKGAVETLPPETKTAETKTPANTGKGSPL